MALHETRNMTAAEKITAIKALAKYVLRRELIKWYKFTLKVGNYKMPWVII